MENQPCKTERNQRIKPLSSPLFSVFEFSRYPLLPFSLHLFYKDLKEKRISKFWIILKREASYNFFGTTPVTSLTKNST